MHVGGAVEVLVVGGGSIGVCCAYELASRGASVVLVDRAGTVASACSAGNSGLLCPTHARPVATPASARAALRSLADPASHFSVRRRLGAVEWLARFAQAATEARAEEGERLLSSLSGQSLDLHAALAARFDTGFERRGVLYPYLDPDAFAHARDRASRAVLSAEALDRRAALELEPSLGEAIAGAIHVPGEAHCDPLRFTEAMAGAARTAGAELRLGVEVLWLRERGGTIVAETTAGVLRPRRVVLAAGVWSGRLARQVGISIPLEGGKGYHVDLEPAPGDPLRPVSFDERHVIVTPLPGRLRVSGQFELAGLDASIDRRSVARLRARAEELVPPLAGRRVLHLWAGLRPCVPDGLPVIGSPFDLDALVVATGHARKGLSLAPLTGRLVADLVAGQPVPPQLEALSPERFPPLLPVR